MMRRVLLKGLAAFGWMTLILAVAWPIAALAISIIEQWVAPQGGYGFTARQGFLLWKSAWMSAAATFVAILISIPAALIVGRSGRLRDAPFVIATLGAVLFCPPMVYAFGWERALPTSFSPTIRGIVVWSFWAWPISSLVIGAAWARSGRKTFEAACLSTGSLRAFVEVAIPSLWRSIALSACALFVIFMGEYTVPHACGLTVYATELLGWAANSVHTIDTAWPALPVIMLAIAGLILVRHCLPQTIDQPTLDSSSTTHIRGITTIAGVVFVVAWIIPLASLTKRGGGVAALREALEVYGGDMAASLTVSFISAILVACVSVVVATSERAYRWIVFVTVSWGVAPGALVGDAMIAAYNRAAFAIVYDHWPIMAICCASRFAWIGALLGLYPRVLRRGEMAMQARTDGADDREVASWITIPLGRGTFVCSLMVTLALSVAELAATTLVRTPDYNPIAQVLVEKFHRFEEPMLVSLSLFLVLASIPAVAGLVLFLRRSR